MAEKLIIKRKGDDGNKVITIRIGEDLLKELDELSKSSNHSRNELINMMIRYGIDNIEIE